MGRAGGPRERGSRMRHSRGTSPTGAGAVVDRPRVLLVHPSAELYGSDRVALESVRAFVGAGAQVRAVLTEPGPLGPLLTEAGCQVDVVASPVLRKAYLSPPGVIRLLVKTVRCTPVMLGLLRSWRPDVVYVSTMTIPWWLVLARLFGARAVCHVHEAEEAVPRLVRTGLAMPLLLSHSVVANSKASAQVLVGAVARLHRRIEVIYNGVPGPEPVAARPPRAQPDPPVRLVLVGRVSPRKGTDVAVAALALLRDRGIVAVLDLVGGVFPGYEWFEAEVRRQVAAAGLQEQVRWHGVRPDVWPALAASDIALVPSRVEPFGNAAVEAMLAWRPVVAGDTQGLREIVSPGRNGRLAAPGDAEELASAVAAMVRDWPSALRQAERAREEAEELFAPAGYRRRIAAAVIPEATVSDHE
jgi:glycosyltransferase involved in cell wall biosynthesis